VTESEADGPDGLVDIVIRGLPVRLYRSTAEHHDELRREFALIHHGSADAHSVPARLERLIEELNARFGSFTAQPQGALHDAIARGDDRIDLAYRVPAAVGEAALELDALLDEVDEHCRAGEHLLTRAIGGAPLAFRRWFLQEFAAQSAGRPPTSWDEHAARSAPPP
jgi:hypothetical protein